MDNAEASIASAPLPTPGTLRRRNNLIFQLWRFIALNVRMASMILKGDH
jgi:hypothetical protein